MATATATLGFSLRAAESKIFSHGAVSLANPCGAYLQREKIPAAVWITLENFQIIIEDIRKSSENLPFPKNLSKEILEYIGFGFRSIATRNQNFCFSKSGRLRTLFLLLMDVNLAEMKIYMYCADPEERRIREVRMRKTLNELSNDPIGQRSCLRLEAAPVLAKDVNNVRGRVFDFSRVQSERVPDMLESSSQGMTRQREVTGKERASGVSEKVCSSLLGEEDNEGHLVSKRDHQRLRRDDGYKADQEDGSRPVDTNFGGFVMRSGVNISTERITKSKASQNSRSSWVRRNQNKRKNGEQMNGVLLECKQWEPPIPGSVKCNIHSNWRNAKLHSGGAFIIRDHSGNVLHHARDAFTFSPNRLTAELRCLEWALQSMKDLGYQEIVLGSDLHDLTDAVTCQLNWPRFRAILSRLRILCMSFSSIAFETETVVSNGDAREIAKSVLRDGRFQSYLALGGPAWLHQQILRDASFIHS
ncbi:hypothetical protein IGI04_005627 [Brassica rapa subsp. trilocularis]|uniref:RNase H type-1 domain-containing protein n=1 Tax=Brassica rapa subsp. trilocularis TaxID=1813537 RepID=A0ABQ7NEI4_BRACM|nr:hypothetical protein IGI04_005627 [Brassica rapa subsp. trilocularis]